MLAAVAAAAARDAAVEAVKWDETPMVLAVDFVGGFAEVVGRVAGFEAAAPSGAVESVVVCWLAASDDLWIVDGRVGFETVGLTVDRDDDAVVVVVGFGLVAADVVDGVGADLAAVSRFTKKMKCFQREIVRRFR